MMRAVLVAVLRVRWHCQRTRSDSDHSASGLRHRHGERSIAAYMSCMPPLGIELLWLVGCESGAGVAGWFIPGPMRMLS